ncbi:MAG TPA: L-erythro-3,5-diaminohexanoate dehydrogenase [Nocardioides sp.]|nr:L-erythro-3,5-diaminohexanoate dehydrogenase [Nocardioides sp.]
MLPQAAQRLDTRPELWPDEVRIRVERLNLDAASFRQLERTHSVNGRGDGDGVRRAVLGIVAERGKMQNPETGSGGMLVGTVEEVGPESPLGLRVGDRVATLVSLTLTPLVIEDGLARWAGRSEQVPCDGYAILFGRSIAARIPDDLPADLSLAVMDVCGAPALTRRVVSDYVSRGFETGAERPPQPPGQPGGPVVEERAQHAGEPVGEELAQQASRNPGPVVCVIGGAGKSGSLSLAAARDAGAQRTVGVVPTDAEAELLRESGIADDVVVADARDPIALRDAVTTAVGGTADITVVCVDVPGCEGGAILTTSPQGTVIFFSMATSFSAAALGAEGLAADVTMLVGNGYVPGHADYAMRLLREQSEVRGLFERRLEVAP